MTEEQPDLTATHMTTMIHHRPTQAQDEAIDDDPDLSLPCLSPLTAGDYADRRRPMTSLQRTRAPMPLPHLAENDNEVSIDPPIFFALLWLLLLFLR